jgi:parallel beta-helix repeat protein
VLVQATNVNIVDVAVDGTSAFTGCSSPSLVGIGFDTGSSGTLRRVAVRNQNIPTGSGGYCGDGFLPYGVGILSQNAGSVTVQDSSVRGFASVGFCCLISATSVVIKATTFLPVTEVSYSKCVVTSAATIQLSNNTVANCANGIVMDFTAQGTITGNTIITNVPYGGGILCSEGCSGGNISGNTVVGGVVGIGSFIPGFQTFHGITFQYNDISGAELGLEVFLGGNTITNNTINDASVGIQGVTSNTVSNNTFLNVTTLTQ